MTKTKQLTLISIYCTLAIVLSICESFLPPPLPVPGIKWGIANIVVLVALKQLGLRSALTIALLRVFITGLLLGTFLAPGFFMSLTGGIFSILVMGLGVKFFVKLSCVGVSVLGAAAHNVGQLLIAGIIIGQQVLIYYLPILLIAAIPTGIITGLIAQAVCKKIIHS